MTPRLGPHQVIERLEQTRLFVDPTRVDVHRLSAVGVTVTVYSTGSESIVATTETDFQGDYGFTAADLVDDTYRIKFGSETWWNGASSWATATPVAVVAATPKTLDTSVGSGSVTGTVQGPGGPLEGVQVTAFAVMNGAKVATALSTVDGTYILSDMPVGDYHVEFNHVGYTTRYSGSVAQPGSAPTVAVTEGGTTAGVDTTLAIESTISKTVYGAGGGVQGAAVFALDPTNGAVLSQTATAADGAFTIRRLNATPNVVAVIHPEHLFMAWGSPDGSLATATQVTPPPGANLAGVSSAMVTGTPTALPTNWVMAKGYLVSPRASLANAQLSDADLSGLSLSSTLFLNAELDGADFTGTDVSFVTFTGADLSGSTFDSTSIDSASFGGANFSDITSSNLSGTPSSLPLGWMIVDGAFVGVGIAQ